MKRSLKKKISFRMAGLVVFLALCACAHNNTSTNNRQSLIQSLQKEGVSVTTVGQDVTIILPSDSVFASNSANILPNYEPVLAQVASLLKTYILVSVQVAAYSDEAYSLNIGALTVKQAQRIETALWENGIDARLVYAEGGGDSNLVVRGGSTSQRSPNRRVEISFRYYPAISYYD